jgi:hypothetical protein
MKNDRIKKDRIKSDRIKSGRIKSDCIKTDRIKRITDPPSFHGSTIKLLKRDSLMR